MSGDVFGIGLEPFGISPDPRFMYLGSKLRREHEILLSGLREGVGLAAIVGGRGIGKTMLLHCLATELDVADHLVVSLSCLGSPSLDDIMGAFGVQIGFPGRPEDNRDEKDRDEKDRPSLAGMLGSAGVCGTTAILLLDDADGLTEETLSALLAMSGGGSKNSAAVSIVLAGSSDLVSRLDGIRDRPPKQELDLNISLTPLKPRDVESYVYHRLHMAGYEGSRIFTPEAIARVARHARGNPQAINRICRAAMVVAAGQSDKAISANVVDRVAPGGGGRTPETTGGEHERRPPRVSAGPDKIREAVAPSGEAMAGKDRDSRVGGAPGNPRPPVNSAAPPVNSAAPSGRDPTSQVALNADAIPQGHARVPGSVRWATLGVLSAVGAVALYLVVTGETNDKASVSMKVPAAASIQEDQVHTSRPDLAAAPAPAPEAVAPPRDTRSLSLERAPERTGSTAADTRETPLNKAILLGDTQAVETLLDAGAEIDARGVDGKTPLIVAAENGDETMVRYLIDRGADPSLVVDRGADPSLVADRALETTDGTVLPSGARLPRSEQGADSGMPEAGGPRSRTMDSEFSTAAGTGTTALGGGLDKDSTDKLVRELLLSTAGDGHRPLNRVQPAGMPTGTPTGMPAGGISGLGTPQSPPGHQERNGNTMAATNAESPDEETGVKNSADLGVTPLIAAVSGAHADVVDVLLAAGAEVDAADARGRTPLIAAVAVGDKESARLLLEQDADIYAVDNTGRSALDIARETSRWDLVHLISTRGTTLPAETTAPRLVATAQQAVPDGKQWDAETAKPIQQARREPSQAGRRSAPHNMKNRARVTQTQRYLRGFGYDPGPVDGIPGSKTRSAVRAFQRDQGAKADGKVTAGLLNSLAAEADAREARRLAAEMPAHGTPPEDPGFFGSILSGLQRLRGLDFNSAENPAQLHEYCGKNRDTWVYDMGTGRSIFCKEYVRNGTL